MVVYSRIRRDETISTNILIIAIIIFLVLIFRVKINFLVFICFELNIRSSIFTKLDKIGPVVNSSVKSDGICLRDKKKKTNSLYISPCHMPHHLVIQYLLEWMHRHNNSKAKFAVREISEDAMMQRRKVNSRTRCETPIQRGCEIS